MKALALLIIMLLARCAEAAISVTPIPSDVQTFNTRPNVSEWATWRVPGGSSDITTPAELDAVVETQTVASFTESLWVSFNTNPSVHGQAGWSSFRQAAFTCPGGTSANLLLATLSNAHTAPMSFLRIGYKQDVVSQVNSPIIETAPGQRVFYSFTGQPNSWVYIPELSDGETSGYRETWLFFDPWPPGALLYLLWADDNSQFEEGFYTIDDFSADTVICDSFPWLQPYRDLQVVEGESASFTISLCPADAYEFQWYKDDMLLPDATNATLSFSPARLEHAGQYYAVLTSADNGETESRHAVLSVSPDMTPPAALVAYRIVETNETNDRIGVYFSERVAPSSAGDPRNYSLRNLDGTPSPAAVTDVFAIGASNVVLTVSPLPDGGQQLVTSNIFDQAAESNLLSPHPATLLVQTFKGLAVVPPTQPWKYFEATNLTEPAGWTLRAFDDAAWPVGAGSLGAPFNEALPPPFFVNTSLMAPSVNGAITTYARTLFQLAPDQTNRVLRLSGVFDDGAAVYLNGAEVWRERLPSGQLTPTTYATNAPESLGPLGSGPIDVFVPGLLRQTNVLAVEVHQVTVTSGDVVMGLAAELSEPACIPKLGLIREAGMVTATWNCEGTLQASTNLSSGIWQDIQTVTNRFTTNVVSQALFFRVRR